MSLKSWWQGVTGKDQREAGKKQQAQAVKTAGQVAQQGIQQGAQYDTGASQSMGANAGEYMQKAQAAAQGQAEQAGQAAATQGSRASLQAARTAGLNPGQAALAGAQQAGNLYGQTYQQGLESGRSQYGQATQQFGQMGQQMAQRALGGAQTQADIAGQQYQQGQQKGQNLWKGVTQVAGAAAGLLSDEEAKTDIRPSGALDEVVARLRPVRFRYKAGTGGNPGEQVGVIAQDVEKSPLAGAVVQAPGGEKVLDTAQLEGSNTALIAEIGARLKELERREAGRG